MLVLKDDKLAECLVVSSHVLTLEHKAKHGYLTQKQLFQLLHETNKQTAVTGFDSFSFKVDTDNFPAPPVFLGGIIIIVGINDCFVFFSKLKLPTTQRPFWTF